MITDDARAMAERRWIPGTFPAWLRDAFVEGYEAGWAAGRAETTTATTEDYRSVYAETARIIHERWQGYSAGEIAQMLADAGLLATARTHPTREDLHRAIAENDPEGQAGDWCYEAQTDAVLALLESGGPQ